MVAENNHPQWNITSIWFV